MDIDEIIIGKIYALMKAKGFSQRALAKEAKINYENFNRLMKGGRSIVKSDVLPEVAKALGVTADFLKSVETTSIPNEPPKESSDRAQSILNIQSDLNILTDRELKNVAKFISDLKMRRTMSSGSGSAGAV